MPSCPGPLARPSAARAGFLSLGFALRAALGELADYALHGRRVVPKRLRELGFTWTYPNLDEALAHC